MIIYIQYNLSLDYKDIRDYLVNLCKKENIEPSFELGKILVKIIHAPGHSPGNPTRRETY